ncbi:MAG: outer membrane lipoprotein carrier protein LolA [Pseudomonadota bacterium]
MKQIASWFLLLLLALSANAADLMADVRARLGQPTVLRGEFEQSKNVAGFKKALVSKGDFLVARDRGVIWRTREPFAGVLKLTPNEIVATQGGALAFKLSANTEPTVRVINGLMFSLLNGDVAALAEQFKIEGVAEAKSWSLTLVPKQAAFAKILTRIELSGDVYVRRIVMDEANGDRTVIQFHKQTPEPAKLSADEAARFD